MLKKEHLRVKCIGRRIYPIFLDITSSSLISLVHSMQNIYRLGIGKKRKELDDLVLPFLTSASNKKVAEGIHKLILDRCEFSGHNGNEYAEKRKILFQNTGKMLKDEILPRNFTLVRDYIFSSQKDEKLHQLLFENIFADLPENESLVSFQSLKDAELLNRYNVSLVQTLLLFSDSITLTLQGNEESGEIRRLFNYLKFFRLLFETKKNTRKNEYVFHISGPTSILEMSSKYGIQLASFFPAVCHCKQWAIESHVCWKEQDKLLKLDETSGLESIYNRQNVYIPEEIKIFAEYFKSNVADWDIDCQPGPLFLFHGQNLVVPDFIFHSKEKTGTSVPMEIFHRWHRSKILERLESCEKTEHCNLILAVDYALLSSNPFLKEKLEDSEYFKRNGMLFREFPSLEKTLEILRKE